MSLITVNENTLSKEVIIPDKKNYLPDFNKNWEFHDYDIYLFYRHLNVFFFSKMK